MDYIRRFFKKLKKPTLPFRVLNEKHKCLEGFEKILEICDENSIEKLNFYLVLGKVVAKNVAFGNSIIFYYNLFRVRGFERR